MESPTVQLLLAAVAANKPRASERARQHYQAATQVDRQAIVEEVAGRARLGDAGMLDLLVTLIDTDRLAIPAIRQLVADDHTVEEVAQDVLVAVAEGIGDFRGGSLFRTWLFGLARNQTLQFLRGQSRQRDRDTRAFDPRPTVRISSQIAQRGSLVATLEQLPEHYRDAVVLRDVEQLSYEEIATELAIEVNTVRSRISRGRALAAVALQVE